MALCFELYTSIIIPSIKSLSIRHALSTCVRTICIIVCKRKRGLGVEFTRFLMWASDREVRTCCADIAFQFYMCFNTTSSYVIL